MSWDAFVKTFRLVYVLFFSLLGCRLASFAPAQASTPLPELGLGQLTPQPPSLILTHQSILPSSTLAQATPAGGAAPGAIWQPAPGTTWQWQLSDTPIDLSLDVQVYDLDLFDSHADLVARLHGQDKKVICYISVGSWEDWRADAASFPPLVIGEDYSGWQGEKWLDIRRIDLLSPILLARLDQCKAKGFDGIEPDNIDGYANNTGFPLKAVDQLKFNTWLAQEAHARGLSIGLKNDSEQAKDLLPYFDWALTEDCFDQGWCEEMLPFIQAGKAVFAAEYTDTGIRLEDICPQAREWGVSAILKKRELDAWLKACQ